MTTTRSGPPVPELSIWLVCLPQAFCHSHVSLYYRQVWLRNNSLPEGYFKHRSAFVVSLAIEYYLEHLNGVSLDPDFGCLGWFLPQEWNKAVAWHLGPTGLIVGTEGRADRRSTLSLTHWSPYQPRPTSITGFFLFCKQNKNRVINEILKYKLPKGRAHILRTVWLLRNENKHSLQRCSEKKQQATCVRHFKLTKQ